MGKSIEKNQKNWDSIYSDLLKFKTEWKRFPSKKDSQKLYTWCAVQRLKMKKNALSEEKMFKLNSIGFIWNIQDYIWNKNYDLLIEYRLKNPGRWPSQRSKESVEHKLAVWFLGIRKDYKKNKLSIARMKKLDEIGFPFYPRDYRWRQTFNELQQWVEQNSNFPMRGSKNLSEQKLFNWCRYQAIKKEYEVLEETQTKLLSEIGIEKFVQDLREFEKLRHDTKQILA